VGKSSVVEGVVERTGAEFSVSATTRNSREGEVDGRDYFFVGDEAFDELVAGDRLVEWAEYGGNRYGTLRSELTDRLGEGRDVVLDIENEGARQVRASMPEAVLVFIVPPSRFELERRLRDRGDTSDDDIARRLAIADRQIGDAEQQYDHLVVNDDLETAISRVVSILGGPTPSGTGLDAPSDGEGPKPRSKPS
jgi:guanylate kinase